MKRLFLIILACTLGPLSGFSQAKISVEDAAQHIGDTVTVCSKVVGSQYNEKGEPTLIFLGAANPSSPLTLVINADKRKFFDYKPEKDLLNRNICVTGLIELVKGKPHMTIWKQDEIKFQ
jgi:hypothetical protein